MDSIRKRGGVSVTGNYSSVSGAMVKHLLEGWGLKTMTMSSKSLV